MSEFSAKSLCVLGRQPALGLAELESLYGAEHIRPIEGAALLDIPAEEINFKRLGGTIKTARVLATLPGNDWKSVATYLRTKIPEHLQNAPEGKFTLGLSVYGLPVKLNDLNKTGLDIKKAVKSAGRPVRIVPNKTLELNSAQVLHNKLTHRGAWELLLVRDGRQTIIAQTLFIQDIEAYAARDQARPARDARVGMLPPKLAQIIINLATGPESPSPAGGQSPPLRESSRVSAASGTPVLSQRITDTPSSVPRPFLAEPPSSGPVEPEKKVVRAIRVLDPFCGTGVILQEAMLMGFNVLGTDLDERMVDYAQQNLKWLVQKYPRVEAQAAVETGDATTFRWPGFTAVASEVYLGRALTRLPAEPELKQIAADANTIIKKFLNNLAGQLKPGQRICLAVPAWKIGATRFLPLPLIDHLTEMGYNYFDLKHAGREELIYFRKDQTVARQLIILTKQ